MSDVLLFGAFPYVALLLLLIVSIQRYVSRAYTVSSLSSQFVESERLFWGSVPFHFGIIFLFFGHLLGFLIPGEVATWNQTPLRRVVLEATALTAGLLTLFGLIALLVRRISSGRLRPLTTAMDCVIYALLLFQVVTGLWIALGYRWGSSWYVHTAVPYLRSVLTFRPDVKLIAALPWVVKLHILGAFSLFSVFSFSRLMHVLVVPVPYLWRGVQLVIWNRSRPDGEKAAGRQ